MKKTILILLIATVLPCKALTQIKDKTNYVILTFEWKRKRHKQNFYWISPVDTFDIKSFTLNLIPLYADNLYQMALDGCIKGDTIDYFRSWGELSEKYYSDNQIFLNLIKDKKIKLQSVSIKWRQDKLYRKQTVKIYATPMYGVFCQCLQIHHIGSKEDFRGVVYLPVSDFDYDDNFWDTSKGEYTKYVDFTLFEFRVFTPLHRPRQRAIFQNTDK